MSVIFAKGKRGGPHIVSRSVGWRNKSKSARVKGRAIQTVRVGNVALGIMTIEHPIKTAHLLKAKKITIESLAKSSPQEITLLMKENHVPIRQNTSKQLIGKAREVYVNRRVDAMLDWLKSSKSS